MGRWSLRAGILRLLLNLEDIPRLQPLPPLPASRTKLQRRCMVTRGMASSLALCPPLLLVPHSNNTQVHFLVVHHHAPHLHQVISHVCRRAQGVDIRSSHHMVSRLGEGRMINNNSPGIRAVPSSPFPCAVMTILWVNKFLIGMNNCPLVDAQGSPCPWMDNTNFAKHLSLRRE